jgi:hypothetical protein
MEESPFDLRAVIAVLVGVAMWKGSTDDVARLLEFGFTDDLLDTIGTLASDQRFIVLHGIHRVVTEWPDLVEELMQGDVAAIIAGFEPDDAVEAEGQHALMTLLTGRTP